MRTSTAMTTAGKLARQATRAAEFRGHRLGAWLWHDFAGDKRTGFAQCLDCKREAYVATHPAPNGIDISGEAVALGCDHASAQ
jgi:hypothetical protein